MEQTVLTIVLEVGILVVGGIGAYALYRIKKMDTDIQEARDRAREAVTEDKVRQIVEKDREHLKNAMDELKQDMNKMASNLLTSITTLENRFNDLLMHMINKRD